MGNVSMGQYLVQKGLITNDQLQNVLAKQKERKGQLFGDVIVDLKYVTDVQFAQVLAERLNVPYVDLDTTELIPDVVKRINEQTARKYTVIAVNKVGKRLTVATNDPINFYVFEDLRVITGCSIVPVLATKASINRAINKYYCGKTEDIAFNIGYKCPACNTIINVSDDSALYTCNSCGGYFTKEELIQN